MKHVNFTVSFLIVSTALLVSSCSGDVKGNLGLRKDSPDEFRVISAPPLSVPPDFSLLPPGTRNAPINFSEKASGRQILGSSSSQSGVAAPTPQVKASSLSTTGDSKFLEKAGSSAIDPAIRDTITNEHQLLPQEQEEKGFFKKMLSLNKDEETPVIVDAAAEKKRIADNKKDSKPVTEGETPTTKEKKSVFERIFSQ